MIDLRHSLALLAQCLSLNDLERALSPCFDKSKAWDSGDDAMIPEPDLFGQVPMQERAPSNAGRPRLALRLMINLLYLKHVFNLGDEELIPRWSENVVWRYDLAPEKWSS